jgi:UDP-GlcNAc:undecaprenyl-phosphate GlcNAc-1-phosphate transferase
MFGIGLADDLLNFRPSTKLICQIIAASVFIFAGGVFHISQIHVVNILVTYVWFLGITNAVNMLDNMDGLASGVVILATLTIVVLAHQTASRYSGPPIALSLGLCLIAVLMGFLLHNRPPARIFMGDSGSLSIGYSLAALAMPTSLNGFVGVDAVPDILQPILALTIPAAVLIVPIFDTTLVTITRKCRAVKATQGGRDHSSHRLVGLGLSEERAVSTLCALGAIGGFVAVLIQRFPTQSLPLFGLFSIMVVLSGIYLGHVKVQPLQGSPASPFWTPAVSELLHKRRAAEVILDTIIVVACFHGSYLLRFEGELRPITTQAVILSLPIVVTTSLVSFFLAGIYRGQWQLISLSELPRCLVGVVMAATIGMAGVTLLTRFDQGHSRSAYIIFGLLTFLCMIGSRLSFRILDSAIKSANGRKLDSSVPRVIIFGAGAAGKLLYQEAKTNPALSRHRVYGFVDDDESKAGSRLCGAPILSWADLKEGTTNPGEIWVSSVSIPDRRLKALRRDFAGITIRRLRVTVEELSFSTRPE